MSVDDFPIAGRSPDTRACVASSDPMFRDHGPLYSDQQPDRFGMWTLRSYSQGQFDPSIVSVHPRSHDSSTWLLHFPPWSGWACNLSNTVPWKPAKQCNSHAHSSDSPVSLSGQNALFIPKSWVWLYDAIGHFDHPCLKVMITGYQQCDLFLCILYVPLWVQVCMWYMHICVYVKTVH